jgi:hypothetical protein
MDYVSELASAIRMHVDPAALPDEPVSDLLRTYAVLALALGDAVTEADVHDAWVSWMAGREPDHESLLPFEQLDADTARQDAPFVHAIREVARERRLGRHRSSHFDD